MSTKMKKGIMRPFRYFTNIMDAKDQEIQIGFPTDVKHVAHIGWDGPAAAAPAKDAGAPTWMKDYHSAPLDSGSCTNDRGGSGSAASNPWASQEIVMDSGGLGETSFGDTKSEAGGVDAATATAGGGDSPPSPNTRRSRRNRSRGSDTSSIDVTGGGEAPEKKEKGEKGKKGVRKNRKKDKDKAAAADDSATATAAGNTCQDLPAVPKKSNRRKNKSNSEASGAGKDGAGAAPVAEEEKPPAAEL